MRSPSPTLTKWFVAAFSSMVLLDPVPVEAGVAGGRSPPQDLATTDRRRFAPAEGTPAEQWSELQRQCEILLESSADSAEVLRWLASNSRSEDLEDWYARWPLTIPIERMGTVDYPTAEPAARQARERLLSAGSQSVPVILNALVENELGSPEGECRAQFAESLLAELTFGQFGWRFGSESGDRLHNELVLRAWTALWERAEQDPKYWDLVATRTDMRTFNATFSRREGGYSLGMGPSELPFVKNELVLREGERLRATTPVGTIHICADAGFGRAYSWEGATRIAVMNPRRERWNGAQGIYYPGPGDHWDEHSGITRGVLQEGQMHFDSTEAALEWLGTLKWYPHVHTRDGLVVGWGKNLSRKQLNVDVWQIYVRGVIPTEFPGADDSNLVVESR